MGIKRISQAEQAHEAGARWQRLLEAAGRGEDVDSLAMVSAWSETTLAGDVLLRAADMLAPEDYESAPEIDWLVGAERETWIGDYGKKMGAGVPSPRPTGPTHAVAAESRQPLCGTTAELIVLTIDWSRGEHLFERCEKCRSLVSR